MESHESVRDYLLCPVVLKKQSAVMVFNTVRTQTAEQGPASYAHCLGTDSDQRSLLSLAPVQFSTWQPFVRCLE